MFRHRVSLQRASIAHHCRGESVGALSIEYDLPTISVDCTAVTDAGLQLRRTDGNLQMAVGTRCEADFLTAREHDVAVIGRYTAGVADGSPQQCYGAIPGADVTLVDNLALALVCEHESVPPGQEVLVGNIQRRGDQTSRVHLGAGAEEYSCAVDQIHPAISGKAALDQRLTTAARDTIKRCRIRAWLVEAHTCVLTYVEGLPVKDGTIGMLLDNQLIALLMK
ncbi:hypothetical protein ALQ02_200097 [Pseudomonas savastanoi pv. phaseolicola]|nr:hypothetical protein ALQ02_200097 [Pseudomonas savastanoi pv. phaseolicola]